jgi:hypothetical protein
MTSLDVHETLGRFLIEESLGETDMLAVMLLFHTHRIRFSRPVLNDRPGVYEVAAITQRHAAEAAAAIWISRADKAMTDPAYWFSLFNSKTPYEVIEDIPAAWMQRLNTLKSRLLEHPDVEEVTRED